MHERVTSMPVSGYVLRMELRDRDFALQSIGSLASVEVGDMTGGGWPVVTDTRTAKECQDLAENIRNLPGVLSLTLVYHNFEDQPKPLEGSRNEKQS